MQIYQKDKNDFISEHINALILHCFLFKPYDFFK